MQEQLQLKSNEVYESPKMGPRMIFDQNGIFFDANESDLLTHQLSWSKIKEMEATYAK